MTSLKIVQINIRSLINKKDILETYLEKNGISAALICETWLKNTIIKFRNYNLISKNRTDGYGGVAILIKKNIPFDSIIQNNYDPIETLETVISWDEKQIKLITIYINPKTKARDMERQFDKLLKENEHNEYVLIGGDINCHNQLWENESRNDRKGGIIAEKILDSDFQVLNDGSATYNNLAKSYQSAIDITLSTPRITASAHWYVDENLTSDHMAIITEIQPEKPNSALPLIKKHTNKKKIIQTLSNTDISSIETLESLNYIFTEAINNNTSMITITKKWKPKPWWNDEINRLWQIKDFKQTLFNKFKNPYTAIELRKINNKLKNKIKQQKEISWEKYLTTINPNNSTQSLWNKINKLKKHTSVYNEFFNDSNNIKKFLDFNFPEKTIANMTNRPRKESQDIFSFLQIKETIKSKKNTSPGLDGISYEILKQLPDQYIYCITKCFNTIWKQQQIPQAWKSVKIIPIHKQGKDPMSVEGYRPISLLPALLKLFNTNIKNKLESYIENNFLLPKNSYGFRKNKSAQDIFFNLNNMIFKNKSEKKHQIIISIDFSKAFDKVNLHKLFTILKKLKVESSIVNWLKQFLFNRKIIFDMNNHTQEITTSAGLPQGSCLSPLLFNIYTIRLHEIETENVKVFQFADDFNILVTGKNKTELKKEAKTAINRFLKIANTLKLPINDQKSGFLNLFKRSKKLEEIKCKKYTFKKVEILKILGISYDEKVNFKKHHLNIKENLNTDINLLKMISSLKHGIHPYSALNIFKATIKSKLDYSAMVTSYSPSENLHKTQVIQNLALRKVLGLTRSTPVMSISGISGIQPRVFQNEQKLSKYILKKIYHDTDFKLEGTIFENLLNKYPIFKKCPKCPKSNILLHRQPLNLEIDTSATNKDKNISKAKALELILDKYADYHQVYTDGSIENQDGCRGIGIFYKNSLDHEQIQITEKISIKQTEIIAIWTAIKEIIIRGNNKMALFTDSLSSLLSLKSHIEGKNDSFYENLIINLAKDNPQVNIVLIWIPSHCGILGNEKADILAKLATSHHPDNRLLEIQIEPQECFRLIMNEINRQWIKFYQDNTTITGKHLRHIIGTPPEEPWFKRVKLSNRNIKIINRLKTGHTYNRKTLHLFKVQDSSKCNRCTENCDEDDNHILFKCIASENERKKCNILKTYSNTIDMFKNIPISEYQNILHFLSTINISI